ncbi:MAG: FtsB family cell division protein [Longimicrobiales bacterium]
MRLRRFILPVIAGAAVYYALFGGEYSLLELKRMERERAREAAALETAEQQNERLRHRADSLATDPATLERLARERFGMIRDGERLYRFADTPLALPVDSARPR